MIQDLYGSWYIKRTGESMTRVDDHDPDRSWITDPDPGHPKGTQPQFWPAPCVLDGLYG